MTAMTDWPYGVERPGPGQVRACPICGREVIFSCWHRHAGDVSAVVMGAAAAAQLRLHSGHYDGCSAFECGSCGEVKPCVPGCVIGAAWECADCSQAPEGAAA